MDFSVFEILLEETKNRVFADTENRFKKKFNLIHYFERERRALLEPKMKE